VRTETAEFVEWFYEFERSYLMKMALLCSALCVLLSAEVSKAVPQTGAVIVGVNVVGVDQLSEQQQDDLIGKLHQNGVTTIRTGLVNTKYARFITQAFKQGIGTIALVYPNQGGSEPHARQADPTAGQKWATPALSDADPAKFSAWVTPMLAGLEASGVHLTAFELGNEINAADFNGDFLARGTGRVLGVSDLSNPNDAEVVAVTSGLRGYVKIAAALKSVRDASKLNKATPIISAGLADFGLQREKTTHRTEAVSIPATIEFLRQNGIDKYVDGYGVHVYPNSDPNTSVAARTPVLEQDIFAACRPGGKACWLTEWGIENSPKSCPINDNARTKAIELQRAAFKPFVDQGRVVGLIYYSWAGLTPETSYSVFRCGALTEAGKLALSPM
jgi:hypothetical protein